jgi:hypothetical protein
MRLSVAGLLAGLLAVPAVAADPAPPPAAYPLAVRQLVAPASAHRLHHFTPPAGSAALAVAGSVDVEVGRQVVAAFGAAEARMFRPPPEATPAGELILEIVWTDVVSGERGWSAEVELEVVLRAPGGAEVDRWRLLGRSLIQGAGPAAVPSAFARATQQAADELEVDFEARPALTGWLAARGIGPGLRREALPILVDRPSLRPLVVLVRPTEYLFADLGMGLVAQGGGHGMRVDLRGGWSRGWLLVQGGLFGWQSRLPFWPIDAVAPASADVWNLGLNVDVGVQHVLGSWALAAGTGGMVTHVAASGQYAPVTAPTGYRSVSDSTTAVAGNLFLAGRYHGHVPRFGNPYHLTLELRRPLGGDARLGAFGTSVPSPDLSVLLLAGFEFSRDAAATSP